MKRFITVLLAFSTVLASLLSCQKEGVTLFRGNYSFKTSGTLTLHQQNDTILVPVWNEETEQFEEKVEIVEHPDPVTASLVDESGQMDVSDMGEDGKVLVTMNVIGGNLVALYGNATGSELVLDSQKRTVKVVLPDSGANSSSQEVLIEGTAHRYEDIVLFELKYKGQLDIKGSRFDIIDSDVVCRAKLNK